MKRCYCLLLVVLMTLTMCFSSVAGTWTHTTVYSDGTQETYETLWFYIKDDGTYAKSEWIQDTDGTWYWMSWTGSIGNSGISDDGFAFNCQGKFLDFSDPSIKPFNHEYINKFSLGMNYEQLRADLGKEHCVETYGTITSRCWHTQDMNGEFQVDFDEAGQAIDAYFFLFY